MGGGGWGGVARDIFTDNRVKVHQLQPQMLTGSGKRGGAGGIFTYKGLTEAIREIRDNFRSPFRGGVRQRHLHRQGAH